MTKKEIQRKFLLNHPGYFRAYYLKNKNNKTFKERRRAISKKSYYKDLEASRLKMRLANRKFRAENSEHYKEYRRAYRLKNREKIREYYRAYLAKRKISV